MLIGVGEIITKSWDLYTANFKSFAKFSLLYLLMSPIMLVAVFLETTLIIALNAAKMPDWSIAVVAIVVGIAVAVGAILLYMLFVVKFNSMVATLLGTKIASLPTKELVFRAALTTVATSLAITLGFVLLIIPGIIFSIWFAFGFYESIFEGKKSSAALSASRDLVAGRWWASLWRLVLPGTFFGIVLQVIQFAIGIVARMFLNNEASGGAIIAIFSWVSGAFLAPLVMLCGVLLYLSLKSNPVAKLPTPTPVAAV